MFENFQKNCEITASQKNEVRQKSQLYSHLVLTLGKNQTSIHEDHVPCGTFSNQHGFFNAKQVQRGPKFQKVCPLDRFYLRTSIALRVLPGDKLWQRAVNRQPDSRSDNSLSRSGSLDEFSNFRDFSEFSKLYFRLLKIVYTRYNFSVELSF